MKHKGLAGGAFLQQQNNAVRDPWNCKIALALITANGNKVGAQAEVVFPGETDVLSIEWHTEHEYNIKRIIVRVADLKIGHYIRRGRFGFRF